MRDFSECKRIVIKVGTSTLTYPNGKLNLRRIDALCRVISDLKNQGKEMVLVSSGAIGVGVERLKLPKKPDDICGRQAAAAVGQTLLMEIYNKIFTEYGCVAGQLLLTKDVLDKPVMKENAQNTFEQLLDFGVVPIVNENDSISVDEIKFGDNDHLSGLVAQLIDADLLILLTDIDGLYNKDPKRFDDAIRIATVKDLSEKIEEGLSSETGKLGTGGILTKVHAARICAQRGISAVIANGENPSVLYDVLEGKDVGTFFEGERV